MSFIAIFLIGFFVLSLVVGPIFGAEDRPAWLRVNQKPPRQV